MKITQNLITKIIQQMQKYISNKKLKILQDILNKELVLSEDNTNYYSNEKLKQIFINAKKIEGCSINTITYYESTISLMENFINKSFLEIETQDIRDYLNSYQENKKSSKITIDNIRRILSSFFSWLEDENYIIKSPVKRIKKIKSPIVIKETYSDEELEIMRDGVNNIRDLALIDILSSTGMRVGELVKMNIEDVNFNERECIVTGKGNKQRVVYFDARTKIHLINYINSRQDKEKALFVTINKPHKRISINGIEARLNIIGKQLNINNVHPHKFRRTLATVAIDKGMPIEQVQRLLGHEKVDTTLKYAMVKQNNVKMSHQKFIG